MNPTYGTITRVDIGVCYCTLCTRINIMVLICMTYRDHWPLSISWPSDFSRWKSIILVEACNTDNSCPQALLF